MIAWITSFFTTGNERSLKAKRHIIMSFVIRAAAMTVGLVLVPMTLNTVTVSEYGVWLTIASFIGWFSFFDVGLGNGLRNKLAEAMAVNDRRLAQQYVSTTYAVLLGIAVIVSLIFGVVQSFVRWEEFFNAPPETASDLAILVPAVFVMFMVQFVVQLIITVLLADQRPAVTNVIGLLGTLLTLFGIMVVQWFQWGSVLSLGLVFMASPLIILCFTHVYLYRTQYRDLAPSRDGIRFDLARSLTSIGGQFFIIQIAVVILFSTSNMIIIHYFGPAEVTEYNIAFKFFNIITAFFVLIATPFWSAITDAYHKGDIVWIKRSISSLMVIWFGMSMVAIVMLLLAPYAYRLWLGETVSVPFSVSMWMCAFVIISNWNSLFAMFLNGTGKIRLQLYSAVVISIINIPLSIGLLSVFGVSGVIMATIICLGVSAVWSPIQYYKVINRTAEGIWSR